ncbi:hypothetical protein EJ04DRAFT_567191 [Polyplosphaeria fusca]|uniref:Uncharacterized protein n=1 Tax=Polyplosphaeria fusca TaxID=682080 RepID=A0A9P4QSV3_9PLEO|nr:hypothetical protein EJ04DRAFT_567191 [Polyplosphaeria fusca]
MTHTPLDELRAHMQCFALPYGGIGFVIHILAYVSIFCIICHQSPWNMRPIKRISLNCCLGILGLGGGLAMGIYSAVQCRGYWPLVVVSIWKGLFALIINVGSMRQNWAYSDGNEFASNWVNLFLVAGSGVVVFGLVGMGATVQQGFEETSMKIVASCSIVAFVALLIAIRITLGRESPGDLATECLEWFAGVLGAICIISYIACDWILGIAANNLSGAPAGRDIEFILVYCFYSISTLISLGNA